MVNMLASVVPRMLTWTSGGFFLFGGVIMFFDRAMLAMGNVRERSHPWCNLLPDHESNYRYSSFSASPSSSVYRKRQSSLLGGRSSKGQPLLLAASSSYYCGGRWWDFWWSCTGYLCSLETFLLQLAASLGTYRSWDHTFRKLSRVLQEDGGTPKSRYEANGLHL